MFSLGLVQVFGVLEDLPARALEQFLAERILGLALQLASNIGHSLVEEFGDVEMIEDMDGVGVVLADGVDVRRGHVGGDRLDLRTGQP